MKYHFSKVHLLILFGASLLAFFFQNCGSQFKTISGNTSSSSTDSGTLEVTPSPPAPGPMPSTAAPTIQIKLSASSFSCRLSVSGSVSCAGRSTGGSLGSNQGDARVTSLIRIASLSGVKSLASGTYPACALMTDGKVMCWGSGTGSFVPVEVPLIVGAKAVANSGLHKCVITAADTVACWGSNTSGELGSSVASSSVPLEVPNVSGAKEISARNGNTCVITNQDRVLCWGSNRFSALGLPTTTLTSSTPVEVPGLTGVGAKSLSMGLNFSCIVTAQKTVKCWGNNSYAQLGNDRLEAASGVVDLAGLANIKEVVAGNGSGCALTEEGAVKCWGYGGYGTLGVGKIVLSSITPVDVVSLPPDIRSISAGYETVCAIASNNSVFCWGDNVEGNMAIGVNSSVRPGPIPAFTAGDL